MFYTKQRHFIHCSLKKRDQNGVVLTALYIVFSPGCTADRGRRFFFLLTMSPPPPIFAQKTPTQPIPMTYHQTKKNREDKLCGRLPSHPTHSARFDRGRVAGQPPAELVLSVFFCLVVGHGYGLCRCFLGKYRGGETL